jgi:amino acid adenylation domain-containing protein
MPADLVTSPPLAPLVVPGVDRSVVARLRDVAEAMPAATAVRAADGAASFAELDGWSDALAVELAESLGGDRHRPVLLAADQTVAGIVGLFAAVKVGRPVVLVDPLLPSGRLEAILDSSGATQVVVCGVQPSTAVAGVVPEVLDVRGRERTAVAVTPAEAVAALPELEPTDAMFVVFTSGSTGRPKGVVHSHAHFLNEAYGATVALGIGPADHVGFCLPLAFGAGVSVVFMALLNGASLDACDPRAEGIATLVGRVQEGGVTTLHCTPSMLRSLMGALGGDEVLGGVRLVTTCGEAIHARDVRALRGHLAPSATYTSWSGSSETGHLAFNPYPADRPLPEGIIPVGYAAPNREPRVVDEAGVPVPVGTTGHLVVRSDYLASGYWDDPTSTAERFGTDPDGGAVFRSSDLARVDEAGQLHLLGRSDSAVKVRGYLVEPSEVEAALLASDDVAEAVVDAAPDVDGSVQLVAYVVPARTARAVSPSRVRKDLHARLPGWMVPQTVVLLEALPRNERGKVDRPALPVPAPRPPSRPPSTELEHTLHAIWLEVLDIEAIGAEDDFFELGGDSIAAIETVVRVRERVGVELLTLDLVDNPTVVQLAQLVDARRGGTLPTHPTAACLSSTGTGVPLFCFAGAGASALSLLPLARELAGVRPTYAFHANGLEARGLADWTVGRAADRHLRSLRLIRPHGPYVLLGFSFGGLVALEVARRLRAGGEQVASVIVVDTYLPGAVETDDDDPTAVVARADAVAAVDAADAAGVPARAWRRPLDTVTRYYRSTFPEGAQNVRDVVMAMRVPLAGLLTYEPEVQRDVFYYQTKLVTILHKVQAWDGRSLLFLADRNHGNRDDWMQVLTGSTAVVDMYCDHVSLLNPPFVHRLAGMVDDEIEAALAEAGAVSPGRTSP